MPIESKSKQSDFHYIPVKSSEEARDVMKDLVTHTLPEKYDIKGLDEFQILVPRNTGELGSLELNKELQKLLLNKDSPKMNGKRRTKVAPHYNVVELGQTYHVGDKVMVLKNDYKKDIFNGDIGFIKEIDHQDQNLIIQFESKDIIFEFDELHKLTLAYAISIHKSQGSEYRAVIVLLLKEHISLAQRNLVYTAITRGKEHVFLIADPVVLESAIANDENSNRWQRLTELLVNNSAALERKSG